MNELTNEMIYETNHILNFGYKIKWSCDPRSYGRREAWKIQDFNGIWARDLGIPVRRSNQLSYETTDVGSWSFWFYFPMNESKNEMRDEVNHILICG